MEDLIKRYFTNKDAKVKLKGERVVFMGTYKCKVEGDNEYGSTTCLDDFRTRTMTLQEMCTECKTRHSYYQALKKLTYENIGIMRKLRNLCQNQNKKN